jgi:LPS-assembly protein
MCYFLPLRPLPYCALNLFNITRRYCHQKSSSNTYNFLFTALAVLVLAVPSAAQEPLPAAALSSSAATQIPPESSSAHSDAAASQGAPAQAASSTATGQTKTFNTRPPLPDPKTLILDEWIAHSINQEVDKPLYIFDGSAEIEDRTLLVRADHIEYNEDTQEVVARGNVYYHGFVKNEQLWCDRMEYNRETQRGKFYNVRGEAMPKVVVRRGVLSGNSPFHFEGEWAERVGERYILYHGWITNCKMPNPWWRMRGPKFDVIPGDRAKAYKSWFILRNIPLFYTPYFYHSLEKEPRHSGFLIPNLVPRSQRGFMVGLGYFWAINRSYDLTYRFFDYNTNALGHHVDFRGKPNDHSDYDFILYGVQDRGGIPDTTPPQRYSGVNIYFVGHDDLGDGWHAVGYVNYVTSFGFRQVWSNSFTEAIGSEIHSRGYLDKSWSSYEFDVELDRMENFETTEVPLTEPNGTVNNVRNAVLIHKFPEGQFSQRDRRIWKDLPVWFSFYSAAGLLYRSEPIFNANVNTGSPTGNVLIEDYQTRQFTPRLNFSPHVTTALHWWNMDLVPSLGIDETYYGQSQEPAPFNPLQPYPVIYQVVNTSLLRSARDFSLDLILPSFGRVFNKKTVFGDKLKHVIEPRATYRFVTGIGDDFNRFIRFDETDLLANTNEVDLSLTNRIYAKRGDNVTEIFTWELKQARYFNPSFGGAVQPGLANVFLATADISAYAFLLGPRNYSPVISLLRANPINGLGVAWQADYDPYYHRVVDSSFSVDYRWKLYSLTAGNNFARLDPLLTARANQYNFRAGFGDANKRGLSAAVNAVYDFHQHFLAFFTTQATYNTDCCGFSVEYGRWHFGLRDETRVTFSFAIANVGTFGSLKRNDRLF